MAGARLVVGNVELGVEKFVALYVAVVCHTCVASFQNWQEGQVFSSRISTVTEATPAAFVPGLSVVVPNKLAKL